MKITSSFNTSRNDFVKLHGEEFLTNLRIAGKCVSSIMTMLEILVKEKTTLTMNELSLFAEEQILKQDCTATFKSYKGFPSAVCISVNKQLVHGIPTDYKLQDGDVVSFDFGATYKGAIADSAITLIYGESKDKSHQHIINTTRDALYAGINAVKVGDRIGVIGNTIYNYARSKGCSVIENYGGHGIDIDTPHAQPFVANKANINSGVRIQPGLVIAIEPMCGPGHSKAKTAISKDGWTIYTDEVFAHEEHSLYVHEDKIEIITERK